MTTINVFLDLETTGLDPQKDSILEVGWIITDSQYVPLRDGSRFIVDHDDWTSVFVRLSHEPYVQQMHEKSGLYAELSSTDDKLFKPIGDIWEELYRQVASVLPARLIPDPDDKIEVVIAGFSIHFDADFIKAHAGAWLFNGGSWGEAWQFHHRYLDLSAIKRVYESVGITPIAVHNPRPHRALDDAREALSYAKKVRTDFTFVRNHIEAVLR